MVVDLKLPKMRCLIILAMLMALTFAMPLEEPSFEDLDIEALLGDEAKAKAAFNCLMDRGPCGELQKLRDSVPEMVETKCSRCTPKQQEKYDQVTKLLFETHPKEFQALAEKYSSKSD